VILHTSRFFIDRLTASLLVVPILLVALACGDREDDPSRPPNVIYIVSDDHGYPDFGFMGSQTVLTPTLDELAAGGTVFRNGYSTSSICAPSLQSLLTGLHPFGINFRLLQLRMRGIERPAKTQLQDFSTLPGLLADRGYRSFQGGKIVERNYRMAGFTSGMTSGDEAREGWGRASEIGRSTMKPVTDFIDENRDRPFFLWYVPLLPHIPHDAGPRFRRPFEERGYSDSVVSYYANILRFDASVKELLDHLDRRGLRERTLIVLLADNGWDRRIGVRTGPIVGLAGDRGKKSMFDLGFRTPIVLNWPGQIDAGVTRDELVSTVDLFPTVLDYAGAPPMQDRMGRSLRPLLEGRGEWKRSNVVGSMVHVRENALRPSGLGPAIVAKPEFSFFLREDRWHFIWHQDWNVEELYDLDADPFEVENLASRHPRRIQRFKKQVRAWQRRVEQNAMRKPGS
jgi:arylsulfatase A-like enzyme